VWLCPLRPAAEKVDAAAVTEIVARTVGDPVDDWGDIVGDRDLVGG